MRIISGEARGRKLFAPDGEDTRPTADRIRESLFNILSRHVYDAEVLDLFGGTGAMALEALSRGARHAVVVDLSVAAIKCITRNAEHVLGQGKDTRIDIIRSDYTSAIGTFRNRRFDLVFLDPPYRMTGAYKDAIERLDAANALGEDCTIVCERLRESEIPLPPGFESVDTRNYGATAVELVRRRESQ